MRYDESWDHPHHPGSDPMWQESDCYWFFDPVARVGGFHRVGLRPNQGTGHVAAFVFIEGKQRFVRNDAHKNPQTILSADRWRTGQRVGSHVAESLGDGRMSYRFEEPGCSIDLEFYASFYVPRDWPAHSDGVMKDLNSGGHLECSGRIRGRIRLGSEVAEIDALAHRDRSWGFRDTKRASLHRYRMFSGTVGPELSFASFSLDTLTGDRRAAGFVSRDGIDLDVHDLRVVTAFDADGLSPLGATAILTLEDGERLRIDCKGVQGFMTPHPAAGIALSDTISTFTYGGRTGFLDLELCNNPGRGTHVPSQSELSLLQVEMGLAPTSKYEF